MKINITRSTAAETLEAIRSGAISSVRLVEAYQARIAAYDHAGPAINSLLCVNPLAGQEAAERDAERDKGRICGPLHGIPVIVKDNIDVAGMPTTAGSQLLAGHRPTSDAAIIARLKRAGAIILAKANMQEFAGGGGSVMASRDPEVLRAGTPPSGYSSEGGQTRNPHNPSYSPSSSSGGTGAAIAAGFASFGLGTDTVMSIRGPCSVNGLFGLKPTNGLLPCDGVVPLAPSLDVVGPMARHVEDIALALSVMAHSGAGRGPGVSADDYRSALSAGALNGVRLGVVRSCLGVSANVDQAFTATLRRLADRGATLVDVDYPDYLLDAKEGLCWLIMISEFKTHIADYLAGTEPGYPRSLQGLVDAATRLGAEYRSPEKLYALAYANQHALELDDPVYLAARQQGMRLVRQTLDAILQKHSLDALVYPTLSGEVPRIVQAGKGDPKVYTALHPSHHSTVIANLAGYPDLTVPMGLTAAGLPAGMSFLGRPYSEAKLLGYAYDLTRDVISGLPSSTPSLETDWL